MRSERESLSDIGRRRALNFKSPLLSQAKFEVRPTDLEVKRLYHATQICWHNYDPAWVHLPSKFVTNIINSQDTY